MRLSVITDEISPDLTVALRACERMRISAVELRTVSGRNLVHHDDPEIRRVASALSTGGFACPAVDTPFLKTPIEQVAWPELDRGFEIAHRLGAGIVRIFSGLRPANRDAPETMRRIADVLAEALDRAAHHPEIRLAMEIEHVCNIATGAQARDLLGDPRLTGLGLVWDPGNEAHLLAGRPDPEPIGDLRAAITHVHVKDANPAGDWVRVGAGIVDWPAQLRGLHAIGYSGYLSMETHYTVPAAADGGGVAATTESVRALRELAAGAGVLLR